MLNIFSIFRFFQPIQLNTYAVTAMVTLTAVSTYQAGKQANRVAQASADEAKRRYDLEAGVAEQQMSEQEQIAMEKMTEVNRKFLQAKGKMKALQAETGVAGKSVERAKAIQRTKASELKGKVAKDIDTNVVNIAQGMLAKKVDTEANILMAELNKMSSSQLLLQSATAGAGAGISTYSATK